MNIVVMFFLVCFCYLWSKTDNKKASYLLMTKTVSIVIANTFFILIKIILALPIILLPCGHFLRMNLLCCFEDTTVDSMVRIFVYMLSFSLLLLSPHNNNPRPQSQHSQKVPWKSAASLIRTGMDILARAR